uniref:secreted and transmembrane protein 1b-like isoform X1 n=1 Tax=Myodes glareolus TaxID=447135 RepID=UPI002020C031|nr:secreted and transmembrane protein 1b-like isoform X1 [Myodes glareolus]XP_048285297.1 secreted and transmembrane protein 1b-like isoform X1 [Myodes glareolus]XP_048285298.1 secreted and transmembrane protein 1b-like isoform X1 [Myodes glareolus]
MVAYPVTSTGSFPRILWTLLLLAASLNAHNQNWDNPVCTKPEVSALRGSCVLMACNISHTFKDVTIELTANGKTMTIFYKKPPGNYFKDPWHLQIQGGHAQLVITGVQDIHAGAYLWRLHGLQRKDENLTLNVTEPRDQEGSKCGKLFTFSNSKDLDTTDRKPESLQVNAEPPSSVSNGVIVAIVIISSVIIGASVYACCKCSRSPKYHRYEMPGPGLTHGFPGGPHWTLPKVFHVLQQKKVILLHGACGGEKRALDPLKPELQTV